MLCIQKQKTDSETEHASNGMFALNCKNETKVLKKCIILCNLKFCLYELYW